MSNPELTARPRLATDYHLGEVNRAFIAALPRHGTTMLSESAFQPNSYHATISGRRLRRLAPGVSAALRVGCNLFIEYTPAQASLPDLPQIDYVITRPKRSPVASETITVAPAYDSTEGFEVNRCLVPRAASSATISPETFEEIYEDAQRFQEEIGYNTLTITETDALLTVAQKLGPLTKPGFGQLLSQIGIAWGGVQGYYGFGQTESELE